MGLIFEPLAPPLYVSTLVGDSGLDVQILYGDFTWQDTEVDLILLDMLDFDVIIGMDWLSHHHIVLDFYTKIVTLAMPGML